MPDRSPFRLLLAVACLSLPCAALAAPAAAAPPANDNYLSSIPINERGNRLTRETVKDLRDTREATVQSDLFSPFSSGGGPENTSCEGNSFGKTVWYDFHPDSFGAVELQTAGFDAAIVVYEFDPVTLRIRRAVDCVNEPGVTEDFFVEVEPDGSYTVQIGGVNSDAGPLSGDLQFTFQFFGDRDRDAIFDPLDRCPTVAGVESRGGCPQEVRSTPKLAAVPTGGGIRVRSLSLRITRGARVSLRCRRGCGLRETRRGGRSVSLRSIRGASLSAGAVVEVTVTKRGLIGALHRYTVRAGNFSRVDRCLMPGSRRPRKRCP